MQAPIPAAQLTTVPANEADRLRRPRHHGHHRLQATDRCAGCWRYSASVTWSLDRAKAAGTEALSIAIATANESRQAEARHLLGFVALSARDVAGAADQLSAADAIIERLGQREPAQYRFHPDLIEAHVGLGELDRAQAQITRLTERARIFPRPWTLATSARCHGLLWRPRATSTARQPPSPARWRTTRTWRCPSSEGAPCWPTARSCGGGRNAGKPGRLLGEALSAFEALGAPIWADRAPEELKRLPVRRAPAGLTATEEQIARLAATGLTNLQIADRAFVSPKTVEANLSRVYAKLGVHSRAQLVLAMSERDRQRTG